MKGAHAYESMPIDELYRWFAGEADPTSPTWGAVCRWVADTPAILDRLDALPGLKRQPNLFLGAIRYLGGPTVGGADLLAWVDAHWPAIEQTILTRYTQTNEPGRCAVLAPVLASLPQPVALFELGASAGLCLLPDRYRYRYDGGPVLPGTQAKPDAPVLTCATIGTPPASPADLVVATRQGLDANPLPADIPEDARWLRSLVWPGEDARQARLSAALAVAAGDPPPIASGRLPDDLPAFLEVALRQAQGPLRQAQGPVGQAQRATPVVFHSATLAYLARPDRDAVVATIRASRVAWVSFEGSTVVTELKGRVPDDERPHFVLALDGEPVARCSPHGAWVDWLG